MDLASKILLQFQGVGTKTQALQTGTSTLKHSFSKSLADGTGEDQADILYAERKVLAASATYDLDLAGVLEDIFGDAATFVTIKGILVINRSDEQTTPTDAEVGVGAAASNQWYGCFGTATDYVKVPAPGCFAWASPGTGKAVTAGTADQLRFTNLDGVDQAEIDIIVLGTSA